MSDGIKVSILVPVYNAELFLVECLDSLMNQTLQKIEIICINDGSKDGSLKIIEKCAKNDKRIRIINKKNSGYGDSMNIGLEKARGEYIGIVEPDDFVDFDAFKSMYDLASRYNADIVKGNYYDYYGNSGTDKQVSDMFSSDIVNRVVDPRIEKNIFYQLPSIWAAIYKREFLINNKISFLPSPGASYQDVGFSFKTWAVARRVYLVKRAFLHYRRDNEKSSVKDSGKIFCVKDEQDCIDRHGKWLEHKKYCVLY